MRVFMIFLASCFVCVISAHAAEKELGAVTVVKPSVKAVERVHTKAVKRVQGELSSLTSTAIAIIYSRDPSAGDEHEILLPMNAKLVKLDHVRSLKDLERGDIVRVDYEEEIIKDESQDKVNFKATKISFVRKGQKPVQRDTETLVSGQEQAEGE